MLHDWPKKHPCHFFIQSGVKPKPIVTCWYMLSYVKQGSNPFRPEFISGINLTAAQVVYITVMITDVFIYFSAVQI